MTDRNRERPTEAENEKKQNRERKGQTFRHKVREREK